MNTLNGKHIILGITGGIAAYKSAELTRRLRDAGAMVRVVMTRGATEFVTPLTFQALSGNSVHTELLDEAVAEARAALLGSPVPAYLRERGIRPYTALLYGLGYGVPVPAVRAETVELARQSRLGSTWHVS